MWWGISGGLGLLDLVCDESERPAVATTARRLAGRVFADVGWQPGPDEAPRQARLRARLVTLLGTLGADPEVRAEARKQLADADAGRAPLPPDLATAVARVIAAGGWSGRMGAALLPLQERQHASGRGPLPRRPRRLLGASSLATVC